MIESLSAPYYQFPEERIILESQDKPSILFISLNRHQRQYFNQLGVALRDAYRIHHIHYSLSDFSGALVKPELPETVAFTGEELMDVIYFSLVKGELRRFKGFRGWMHSQQVLENRAYYATLYFYNYMCRVAVDLVCVWNGLNIPVAAAMRVARKLDKKTAFFENGYLPDTTTLDPWGVNYKNSLAGKPRSFYDAVVPDERLLAALYDAAPVGRRLKKKWYQKVGKKQKRQPEAVQLPSKYIFLPFQVHDDTQVLLYSPHIRSMEELVRHVVHGVKQYNRHHREDVWIVVKEHPSDFGRVDYSQLKKKYQYDNIIFLRFYPTSDLIAQAQGVITINSTVGIEALVRHKPVITLGDSCYNIEGLVYHVVTPDKLAEAIRFIHNKPDHSLIDRFLYYLRYCYLVTGSWRQPTAEHYENITGKITEILLESGNK